jgi:DNA helicase HerA-like ATPase
LSDGDLTLLLPTPFGHSAPHDLGDEADPGSTLVLGRTDSGELVGPSIESGEGRHLAILGETGMGKSSLLVTVGLRALERASVVLLDPLGETVEALSSRLGPRERERTILLSPLRGPALNALEGLAGPQADAAGRERRLNDLVHALRRVRSGRYPDSSFWGPRLEEMLQRAVSIAAAIPGGTLEDAHLLLAAGGRGFRPLPPEVGEAASELARRIRTRPDDAEGARRLLYEVVRSPVLVRALCGRTPERTLESFVAPGRLLLVSGDAAQVGETNARFFLAVYLALLWSTHLARTDRAKCYLLLDEAHWFAHESLAEMLRLGRRRNLHVVLATQSIRDLPEGVAEAVWTNVADFVTFRGSPTEAREFSRLASDLRPESVLSLPRGRAVALIGKGEVVRWIRAARPASLRSTPESDPPLGKGAVRPSRDDPPESSFRPQEPPSRAEESVIACVRRRIARARGSGPVRVDLAELRREADPSGEEVRRVGAVLGRAGALVRTERGPAGTAWWVDPDRAGSALEVLAAGERERDADGPQPS